MGTENCFKNPNAIITHQSRINFRTDDLIKKDTTFLFHVNVTKNLTKERLAGEGTVLLKITEDSQYQ